MLATAMGGYKIRAIMTVYVLKIAKINDDLDLIS